MTRITGYDLKYCLYRGPRATVYRAIHTETRREVVVKMHAGDFPSAADTARFRREFELGRRFHDPHIIGYEALVTHHHGLALVVEDFGGISLGEVLPEDGLPLDGFLRLAVQLTQALQAVHQEGVVHKDIKPSNVMVNPESMLLKLIDFGIAGLQESPDLDGVDGAHPEGTMAYLSPEQTGRMNRKVDYRADFYSLGVTFYEMLTGRLPFTSGDAPEMIHCHIARNAVPVHDVQRRVPRALSDMVAKLMAKSAEDRYQSAAGLLADLERCSEFLVHEAPIADFSPGERDLHDRFQLSQKLYGREEELKRLSAVVARMDKGGREMVLVSGPTGSGKSTLIHEMQRAVVNKHGYFISGKFCEELVDTPYGALLGALRDLLRQILMEQDAGLNAWKETFHQGVGDQIWVLVEALPELERILGPRPATGRNRPRATENRFHFALKQLLFVTASRRRPLALLLDDLEFADEASLQLVSWLLTEPGVMRFVWFATWSGAETGVLHPRDTLERVHREGASVTHIDLKPLNLRDITGLIAETLGISREKAALPADLVFSKTEGNPYFVGEFLKTLYQKRLLRFEPKKGTWRWDFKAISDLEMTPNVVDLLAEQFKALPEKTRKVLKPAAVLGLHFDLHTLSELTGEPTEELVNALWPALEEGLIISRGPVDVHGVQSLSFKFSHDRLQKATYDAMDEAVRAEMHLLAGRLLLPRGRAEEGRIFEITAHLNKARHLISDARERLLLVRADTLAAKKALAAGALDAAGRNLHQALACLPDDCWDTCYETAFDLFATRAHQAWLSGETRSAEKLYRTLTRRAAEGVDTIRATILLVEFYNATGRFRKAWTAAEGVIRHLEPGPGNTPGRLQVKWEQWRLSLQTGDRMPLQPENLPECRDEKYKALLELLMTAGNAVYQLGMTEPYEALCMKMLRLSLVWGNAPASAYAYVTHGMLLCTRGRIEAGMAFGKAALALAERHRRPEICCRVYFLYGSFIHYLRHPLQSCEALFDKGFRAGVESGNPVYSAWCLFSKCLTGLLTGRSLKALEEEITHLDHLLGRGGTRFHTPLLQVGLHLLRALQGLPPNPDRPEGSALGASIADIKHGQVLRTGVAYAHFAHLLLHFHREDWAKALEAESAFHTHFDGIAQTPCNVEAAFYGALARTGGFATADSATRTLWQEDVAGTLRQFAAYAESCPVNFRHKYLLLQGEWNRIQGEDASDAFDQAVEAAHEHGFPHHVALANELAGRYWTGRKRHKIAAVYLLEAQAGYQRWGLEPKAGDLQRLLAPEPSRDREAPVQAPGPNPGEHDKLDLQAIIKASLAVSSEIDFRKLVGKILSIMMENAGAERGFLILTVSGTARVEAMAEGEHTTVSSGEPLNGNLNLSEAVVRFVIRSGETVVLTDAAVKGMFAKDESIRRRRPKSVLCTPIRQKERIVGALYLENNLTSDAFSHDRVQTLEILLAQAALCLEHARLYTETISLNTALKREVEERKTAEAAVRRLNARLEQRVKERTAQLEASQKELVENAHAAGMADIATSVLHNVGNILSSVTTAGQLLHSSLSRPTVHALHRANTLAAKHMDDLESFFVHSDKGHKLLLYFQELEKLFSRDYEKMTEHLVVLMKKVDCIRDVIMAQQSVAAHGFRPEPMRLSKVVDDAVSIMSNALSRNEIQVIKNYAMVPPITLQKTKITHIVINLLKNAQEAMLHVAAGAKCIIIDIDADEAWAYVRITDVGHGVAPELKDKIFNHGFTTKKDGQGFGLHACANAMTEMGGRLRVQSEGRDKGATFIMELPMPAEVPTRVDQETAPV